MDADSLSILVRFHRLIYMKSTSLDTRDLRDFITRVDSRGRHSVRHEDPSCCPVVATDLLHPSQSLATTKLVSISVICRF